MQLLGPCTVFLPHMSTQLTRSVYRWRHLGPQKTLSIAMTHTGWLTLPVLTAPSCLLITVQAWCHPQPSLKAFVKKATIAQIEFMDALRFLHPTATTSSGAPSTCLPNAPAIEADIAYPPAPPARATLNRTPHCSTAHVSSTCQQHRVSAVWPMV